MLNAPMRNANPDSRSVHEYVEALFRLLRKHAPGTEAAPSGDSEPDEERATVPSKEQQVIVRPEQKAANGQITAVQAALRNGWELTDIELREGPNGEESRLAFLLQRSERPSRRAVG